MGDEQNKLVDAVTRLTKLTQDSNLKWSSAPSPVLAGDDAQRFESVFTATHKWKRLRLSKRRVKVEDPNPFGSSIGPFGQRYPFWTSQIVLEIVDEHDHNLWTFPEVRALRDLLTSVKHQVSGVDEFLNDLVKESGEPK